MRFKILPAFAAMMLLAACETTPETASASTGGAIRPGSQEDLAANAGDRVFFGFDRYELTSEARTTLTAQAGWLRKYPDAKFLVEGHADERGTREYNLALGARRANATRDYLVAQGVEARRLSTTSFGKERPAVQGSNDSAWAQNRRAVSTVQ